MRCVEPDQAITVLDGSSMGLPGGTPGWRADNDAIYCGILSFVFFFSAYAYVSRCMLTDVQMFMV
jgi:hypothetical protein